MILGGMQRVPCYREGSILQKGQQQSLDPPFAYAVVNGETVCLKHLESRANPEEVRDRIGRLVRCYRRMAD